MDDPISALANYYAYRRAMDAAWRWLRRRIEAEPVKLSEIVARVQAKCPDADPARIKSEFENRIARTKHRQRR
jgi:hypothetical protein